MACKDRQSESRESRRENIATGAIALGELVSGEKQSRGEGAQVPDEMARVSVRFAAGLVQFVKRVCAEELEPYAVELQRVALMTEPERAHLRGEATRARWAAEVRTSVQDARGEAILVGDGFRRASGPHAGGVVEVTGLDGYTATVTAPSGSSWPVTLTMLLDPAEWTRVDIVAGLPAAMPIGLGCSPWSAEQQAIREERLARAAESPSLARALADAGRCAAVSFSGDRCLLAIGHDGPYATEHEATGYSFDAVTAGERLAVVADDDLDGPAGDGVAPGLTEAGAAALGSGVTRADLDGLIDDVAKLVEARGVFAKRWSDDKWASWATLDDAIDALSLRAGQLRHSRLAGGQ